MEMPVHLHRLRTEHEEDDEVWEKISRLLCMLRIDWLMVNGYAEAATGGVVYGSVYMNLARKRDGDLWR